VSEPAGNEGERARLIHREIQQLILLIAVAVLAFFATRLVALQNRAMRRGDAAEWFRRGDEALRAGRTQDALEMFRHAVVRDPLSRPYKLALARSLDAAHQDRAAADALLALRDIDPENADVNIALARLTAHTGDTQAAVRYYQSALNALWRPADRERQQTLRLELIRMLIDDGQRVRALPELLTLAATLPEDAALKTRVASLLMEVDEPRRALPLFRAALALDPSDRDARAGAARASALIAVGEQGP
jgi:predicted Zn-dependent protease